jgi:hypothetical protein
MIDDPFNKASAFSRMNGNSVIDDLKDIAAPPTTNGVLSADQALHGHHIPPQQQILLYSDGQWEDFVHEWAHYCLKALYTGVQRLAGAGDRGIDVAGFTDANKLMGVWDNYQDIYSGVIDIHDGTHRDGYERLCAVTKAAREMQITSNALITRAKPQDRDGICHQLANEDRLAWRPLVIFDKLQRCFGT